MSDFLGWTAIIGAASAWLTHVFTCFNEGLWGFLIAGALFFPLGILHGLFIWIS